jgi:peptidoglycan hydrolase-like protein with peptidoglycan-binding domain
VDGIYGGNTTEGVKAFQQKEGLPVTGIADEATRRLLLQRVV